MSDLTLTLPADGSGKLTLDVDAVKNKMFGTNATFKKPPTAHEFENLDMVRAMLCAVEENMRFLFVGPQGTGKTSFGKAIAKAIGAKCVYIPAAVLSVENLLVAFPGTDADTGAEILEILLYEQLMNDEPKIIEIDEPGRADPGMMNVVMELIQEGTLAGQKIPNLLAVAAFENPQGMAYGRLQGMDFSQADRFATVELTQASTPWQRALADEFPTTDLTDLLSWYLKFSATNKAATEYLSPRVLSNVIYALLAGFPAKLGLPILDGRRIELHSPNGDDITAATLDKIADALGVPNRAETADIMERAVEAVINDGINIYLEGTPGVGKTSRIKQLLAEKDVDMAYYSVPATSPEDLCIPFPNEDRTSLKMLLFGKLQRAGRKVLVLDEARRGDRRTQNAIMEPVQERSIGGQPIEGLLGTIAINNPREMANGYKLDVGRVDLAQAARYRLNIQLKATDTKFGDFLLQTYGEGIEAFLEWWKEDLDNDRDLITPRCLERLYKLHRQGLPLEWAKPYVGGEHIPVPLVELEQRLANRPVAKIRAIAGDVDTWDARLSAGDPHDPDDPEAHMTVYRAFANAELTHLQEYRAACVQLLGKLSDQFRLQLINEGGERKRFWFDALLEAIPEVPQS